MGYGNGEQGQEPAGRLRRSRRASFHSMYDAEDESTGVSRSRVDSRASESRLHISKKAITEARPSSRATTRPTERISNPTTSRKSAALATRTRLTAEEWTQSLPPHQQKSIALANQRPRESLGNIPNDGRLRQQTLPATQTEGTLSSVSDLIEDAAQFRDSLNQRNPQFVLGARDRFYTPSKTQLLRDADTFQSYRIRSVARDAIEKWCYAALESKDKHEHMQRISTAHDKEVLLRQAFEHWRLRLHAKKQAAETRRYFERLELRANKARDLYLLTKAFTHWSQCAEDEALRMSLARQHVLSIKYFHAWKDLTVANQSKAHLQGLRKHLSLWRQRHVQVLTNDIKADLADQRRLMKSAYWHWFWGFCEARAPEWQVRRLKQRYLLKWVEAFQANRQRNQQVTLHVENAAKRFFLSQWLKKAQIEVHNQDTATTYSRQSLSARALQTWIRVRRHGPLAEQMSNMVDWRVAGATFATFVNNYRLEKQAESLNRVSQMRNAWTQWNDRLRWQTLARRIDDRHLLEALYKWTIAERLILMKRLMDQRLKERYLLTLKNECALRKTHRKEASRTIETRNTRRSLHLILSQWRLRCEEQRQNARVAYEFHAPKVTYEALQSLTQRLQHIRKLDKMAGDAVFYFTVKRCIKLLNTAAVELKRQKRRNAYIRIRRKTKMDLASNMLQRWRSSTAITRDMANGAEVFNQNRLLQLGASLFAQWRGLYDLTVNQQFQASDHYEAQLAFRRLRVWSEQTAHLTELENTAAVNANLRVQSLAFGCLNKLRLRIIELKGPQATAENLEIRYEKRHFYNMLRKWQDKTADRLHRPQRARIFTVKARRTRILGDGDDRLGATARAEEWTELDQGEWIPQLEAHSSATPLPSYLSTPSKRAARARALIQESTTPAGTPFQNRLRAQLSATPRTTKRELFGRSTALRSTSFGALFEGSGSTTIVDKDE